MSENPYAWLFEHDARFHYAMLDRLKNDCLYYLGYGARHIKYLWAHDVEIQIDFMKVIWNRLEEKPEWLSMEQLEELGRLMRDPAALPNKEIMRGLNHVYRLEDGSMIDYVSGEPPCRYKDRCKDCPAVLAGEHGEWICDERQKQIQNVETSPEGLELPEAENHRKAVKS